MMEIPMTAGDWDVRGPGLDGLFSGPRLTDLALTAVIWTDQQFSPGFPGWPLYRTVASGDTIHMRTLTAYAIGMARAVTRAKRRSGNSEVSRKARRNEWIAAAGLDALHIVLYGRPSAGINARASELGVSNAVYQRVRDCVREGMTIGLETYRSMLFANVMRVRIAENEAV